MSDSSALAEWRILNVNLQVKITQIEQAAVVRLEIYHIEVGNTQTYKIVRVYEAEVQ